MLTQPDSEHHDTEYAMQYRGEQNAAGQLVIPRKIKSPDKGKNQRDRIVINNVHKRKGDCTGQYKLPSSCEDPGISPAKEGPVNNLLPECREYRVKYAHAQEDPDIGPGKVKQVLAVEIKDISQHHPGTYQDDRHISINCFSGDLPSEKFSPVEVGAAPQDNKNKNKHR